MSKYEVRYVGDWISYIYDNETKESVRISNEDFVRLLNKQDKQISDLEAKLAESESCAGMLHHHLTDKAIEIEMLGEEIEELKTENMNIFEHSQKLEQQLAEKDRLHMQAMDNALNDFLTLRQELNEDKISFAIAELKKAREIAYEDWLLDGCCNLTLARVLDKIDNQIKQLKEMK